jgi:hypothetical protein
MLGPTRQAPLLPQAAVAARVLSPRDSWCSPRSYRPDRAHPLALPSIVCCARPLRPVALSRAPLTAGCLLPAVLPLANAVVLCPPRSDERHLIKPCPDQLGLPDEAKRALQKIEQSFVEVVFSHIKHTFFTLKESELPYTTYACES